MNAQELADKAGGFGKKAVKKAVKQGAITIAEGVQIAGAAGRLPGAGGNPNKQIRLADNLQAAQRKFNNNFQARSDKAVYQEVKRDTNAGTLTAAQAQAKLKGNQFGLMRPGAANANRESFMRRLAKQQYQNAAFAGPVTPSASKPVSRPYTGNATIQTLGPEGQTATIYGPPQTGVPAPAVANTTPQGPPPRLPKTMQQPQQRRM